MIKVGDEVMNSYGTTGEVVDVHEDAVFVKLSTGAVVEWGRDVIELLVRSDD